MRGRHRDLIHVTSSVGTLYADTATGSLSRRFAAAAERHWDVSHPIRYWRADGSVYAGRSAPPPGRGWFSGFLAPLALLGLAGAGAYRYGRLESEPLSPEVVARDARDMVATGMNNIYKMASMNKNATLVPNASPDRSDSAGSTADQTSTEELAPRDSFATSGASNSDTEHHTTAVSGPLNPRTPDASGLSSHTATAPSIEQASPAGTSGQGVTPSGQEHTESAESLMHASAEQADGEAAESDPHVAALNALSLLVEQANAAVASAPAFAAKPAVAGSLPSSRQPLPDGLKRALRLREEPVLRTAGFMGAQQDISASSLLAGAEARADAPMSDVERRTALKQALADVDSLKVVLQQVAQYHSAELGRAVAEAEQHERTAQGSVGAARAAVQRAQRALAVQEELAARYKDSMLHLQELSLAVQFEQMANKERGQRHKAVDEMRGEVNAIAMAFEGAAERLSMAEARNVEALAVLDLCKRLDRGAAVDADVERLRQTSKDGIVQAAVHSLPAHAATQGVATAEELVRRWGKVRRALRVNMAISDSEHAGFVSMSLATISSALKVSEWAAVSLGQERTPEAQLAVVDNAMRERDFALAVAKLEKLSQGAGADHVLAEFIGALKARAVADQAAVLLHAHQTVLSTSYQLA
eukprot:jgi/Ulvmu1/10332/UM061_0015.1